MTDMSFNDWLNTSIFCNYAGDIYVQYNPQLLLPFKDKLKRTRAVSENKSKHIQYIVWLKN